MSAIQFNLLPDVKLEFDKAQRAKRFVFTVSFLAAAIVLALFIVSFLSVNVLQKKLLTDADKDIQNYSQKLQSITDIDKILTIQNQLHSLPELQNNKHYASRLFVYLPQVTPTKISVGKLTLDTTASTISITGTADTVETVNRFVDTLKFTSYIVPGQSDQDSCEKNTGRWNKDQQTCTKLAFSNVLLSKVNRDDKGASYTVDTGFDPVLFVGSTEIKLLVPQEVTTRSVINAPDTKSPLFNGQTGKPDTNEQGTQ